MSVKIEINESALNDAIREAVQSAVEGQLFDIACPHCGATISVPKGLSQCPNCGNTIDLTLDIKLD